MSGDGRAIAGGLSPVAAVAAAYDRLAGSQDGAWIAVVPRSEAMARAAALEAEGPLGRPLWGVPFAVKDNIDVAGMATTAACPAFAYEPVATAPAVQRLLDAGAVLVGKTNLDQFATGLVGTRSPYGTCHSVIDRERISGGSSSGSAVAVAEGVVAFSLGTDTAGSGRVPAAANGIVGLKPTLGLVSTAGVVPACRSIDCVSVFARSVADARAVLDALAGPDPADPYSRPTPPRAAVDAPASGGRWRVGVPPRQTWELAAAEEATFAAAVEATRTWADVVEVDPAPFLAAGALLYGGALVAERLTTAGDLLARQPEAIHPVVRDVLRTGVGRSAAELFADQHRLAALTAEARRRLRDVDVLLFPTVPDVPTVEAVGADPLGVNANLGRWTTFVNLLDLCAVTVPTGPRSDGLVGSATVIGPAFTDAAVAAVAAAVSGETPPPGSAAGEAPEFHLAVVGAHLTGMPLNGQLTELGARFVAAVRTAPVYRLHALATEPPKPGMVRDTASGGAIEAEVWALDAAAFGAFVAAVPHPLCVGTVELEDGTWVKGFLCEPDALDGAPDITATGSWRRWVDAPIP